jgi:hypothetical protein
LRHEAEALQKLRHEAGALQKLRHKAEALQKLRPKNFHFFKCQSLEIQRIKFIFEEKIAFFLILYA